MIILILCGRAIFYFCNEIQGKNHKLIQNQKNDQIRKC